MAYPDELTTSDWVDYLATLPTRDEQIAALATFHRRVQYDAKVNLLGTISDPDPKVNDVLQQSTAKMAAELPSLSDYVSGIDVVAQPAAKVLP